MRHDPNNAKKPLVDTHGKVGKINEKLNKIWGYVKIALVPRFLSLDFYQTFI